MPDEPIFPSCCGDDDPHCCGCCGDVCCGPGYCNVDGDPTYYDGDGDPMNDRDGDV